MDTPEEAGNDAEINDSEAKQRYADEKYYALKQKPYFLAIMTILEKEKIENARSIGLGHFQKY